MLRQCKPYLWHRKEKKNEKLPHFRNQELNGSQKHLSALVRQWHGRLQVALPNTPLQVGSGRSENRK